MAEKTKEAEVEKAAEVEAESNHNTLAGVDPVSVAQVNQPDYNPQRRPSSKANIMSGFENADDMKARVKAKS